MGVQKIYQGDTVSYIMTEMLVRCWKREKRRERIAKLAGNARSVSPGFLRGEKSRPSSGTRVATVGLNYSDLYIPSLQEEVSLRHGF